MILSDRDIENAVTRGDLKINPFVAEEQIQPASVDLTLDTQFVQLRTLGPIRPDQPMMGQPYYPDGYTRTLVKHGEYFGLAPGGFVLASTRERVELPNWLTGEVRDKSSVARLGLSLLPAGYIDPGFRGHITLEIVNHTQYVWALKPGMRICQLVLFAMFNRPARAYGDAHGSRYQDQPRGPVVSRIHEGKN